MLNLTGGKNKSKKTETQSFNQTSNTRLSDRAYGLLSSRINDVEDDTYKRLDPDAYKDYEDPYQQEVIDATTADIMAARAQAMNADRAMLAGAGAFGDDRRGIVEAETAGNYDRTLATTLAGLRSGGFRYATGVAQGENTNENAYNADLQRRIDALIAMIAGGETTTSSYGTSQGTATGRGSNLGFSFSPFKKG